MSFMSYSQNCGYDYIMKAKGENYKVNYQFIYDYSLQRIPTNTTTYYIPVVFHVVYNNESQNIPDSVLYSQIEVLNEDYRRLNSNSSNTRDEFLEFAGDANIEFFLANIDPSGNPTNGIIKQSTDRVEFLMFEDVFSNEITLDEVKSTISGGSDAWDTNRYLNIWICNIGTLELFGQELGQVFGYAYPPTNIDDALSNLDYAPEWPVDMLTNDETLQGVVLHYTAVGRNNPNANDDNMTENNLGRAAVHEIGHFLGLRHIWGDAIALLGEDGCSVDDGIQDTPNANDQAGYLCDFNKNTCSGDTFGSNGDDLPDMVENYMDYSPDACQNIFTNGQINIMQNVLEISRPNLINIEPEMTINETIVNEQSKSRTIIKQIDLLGRNSNQNFCLKIYDDGYIEKRYKLVH